MIAAAEARAAMKMACRQPLNTPGPRRGWRQPDLTRIRTAMNGFHPM